MSDAALKSFHRTTSLDVHGFLTVNAGKYSRAAVIAVFEMVGGVEAFAGWAEANKSEFYTKMFGKVIGREVEHKAVDSIEDLLLSLDTQEANTVEVPARLSSSQLVPPSRLNIAECLPRMADEYAAQEQYNDHESASS